VRTSPLESLNISISRVGILAGFRLLDDAEFHLHASEEDMQKAIVLQPSIIEAGLEVLDYERRVEPGFVDIYAVDRKGNAVVIEIKKDSAGVSAVKQLAEYLKYIQPRPGRKLRPMIVAPGLAKGEIDRPAGHPDGLDTLGATLVYGRLRDPVIVIRPRLRASNRASKRPICR